MQLAYPSSSLSSFDKYFNNFFSDPFPSSKWLSSPMLTSGFGDLDLWNMSDSNTSTFGQVDIKEDDKSFNIKVELAGMKKDDIKVEIKNNNRLVISGEKKEEREDKEKDEDQDKEEEGSSSSSPSKVPKYYHKEISYGKFKRSFDLGDHRLLDIEKINANHQDGVMEITIPKIEPVEPSSKKFKRINIH